MTVLERVKKVLVKEGVDGTGIGLETSLLKNDNRLKWIYEYTGMGILFCLEELTKEFNISFIEDEIDFKTIGDIVNFLKEKGIKD